MTTSTWAVLADPSRRAILDVLREKPSDVGGLVARLRLTQPGTSKHLRVLRAAGLVSVEPTGQRRIYSVAAQPLAELDAWLGPYRSMWNDSLDRLGAHLDSTKGL